MLQQLDQHTARLVLKLELDSVFAELKVLHVEFEHAEAANAITPRRHFSFPA
jgi:hypothetical protein